MQQTTDTILMVRPINFRKNEQTAVNNYFQEDIALKNAEINLKAQQEFDAFVDKLKAVGINVIVPLILLFLYVYLFYSVRVHCINYRPCY